MLGNIGKTVPYILRGAYLESILITSYRSDIEEHYLDVLLRTNAAEHRNGAVTR